MNTKKKYEKGNNNDTVSRLCNVLNLMIRNEARRAHYYKEQS